MLICLVYIIAVYIDYVWNISTKDEFCSELVECEVNRVISNSEVYNIKLIRQKLFDYYTETLGKIEFRYSTKTLELIKSMIDKKELEDVDLRKLIDMQITDTFNKAVPIIGYTTAISEVLDLYNADDSSRFLDDKIDVLIKPINQLQFYNEEKFSSSSMTFIYRHIEELDSLNTEEKSIILYKYFSSIYFNDLISFEYKSILINNYFMNLLSFSWREASEYDIIRKKTVSRILRDNVLLNSNKKLREMIFLNIVESLRENIYTENIEYYNTLAIILVAINFYSFKEVSTLDTSYRDELKILVFLEPVNIKKKKIRFLDLILQDIKKVVESVFNLGLRAAKDYRPFEYFPYTLDVKEIVWTQESIIDFGFKLYLLYYYYILKVH